MGSARAGSVVLALIAATWVAFWPTLDNDFVAFDDPKNITANPNVQAGLTLDGLAWALTSDASHNWHPVTWVSHMLDVELFGLDPRGHHGTSIAIHALNGVLLFALLRTLTGAFWCSALAAALLLLHPLRVESVAWAAERKDVLATLFWLVTIGVYASYVRHGGAARYAAVLLSYALGLMSKPMLVSLPLVLLLLDLWPLERLGLHRGDPPERFPWAAVRQRGRRLVLEKLPLMAMAVATSAITARVHAQIIQSDELFPLSERIANAALAVFRYLELMLWPRELGIFYPHLGLGLGSWQVWLAFAAIVAISVSMIRAWRRPQLAVGWFWFLASLLPVIGLVQAGLQSIADRYSYIPSIGLSIAVLWSVAPGFQRSPTRRAVAVAASGVVLVLLTLQTRAQTLVWKDSVSLFRNALAVSPDHRWTEFNLAVSLMNAGDDSDALRHFERAVALKPHDAPSLRHIGTLHERQGRREQAIAAYARAVEVAPADQRAALLLARLLHLSGRHAEAEERVRAALDRWPDSPELLLRMGLLRGRNAPEEAIPFFERAVAVRPSFSEAHTNLGIAYASLGDLDRARAAFRAALRADPRSQRARQQLHRLGPAR